MRFKYVPSIPQCNNHSPYHKNQNISPTDALYIHNFWTAVLFAHFQIFRRSNHRYFWSHLTLPTAKAGDSCFFHYCIDKYLTVLQCLIQCPQAMFILFPYALRYSFSSLCRLHLQCFFQNINACIRIPVMNCMAFRALPDTNAQIFYPWISVAARAAGLTARIHRWYSVKFISIPDSFIFQHFEKLCPGNTCYGFCQFMVPDHSLHVQILDTDGLVFAHQHRWLFL